MTENAVPTSTESRHLTGSEERTDADSTHPHPPVVEARGRPHAPPELADLQADIERTRQNLADTVDQLAAKLDVRTQVLHRLEAARDVATRQLHALRNRAGDAVDTADKGTVWVGGGVFAAVVAVFAVGLWRRNQRPRRRGRRLR